MDFHDLEQFFFGIVAIVVMLLMSFFMLFIMPRKDFFTRTHYPIRFNRKKRMVYVYRDKCDGGVLRMPWDAGYFHIGQGIRDKVYLDLRCHLLDGDIVKDTFPVGFFFVPRQAVQELWEFIRVYMEEGPEVLQEDTIITATPSRSWRNSFVLAGTRLLAFNDALVVLLYPFIVCRAFFRWLVMKSCQLPSWPVDIEEVCQIEPNDPNQLAEPAYSGQPGEDEKVYAKMMVKQNRLLSRRARAGDR
ncbi:DUF6708 domain-containing protein [Dyella acidiphila]|uniref:DUF6708 domain-containing protein n=1 Tax=Dyella acidiphila TaxID=2775866 RepID=A0ABR9GD10_9GAMM|nr:DUF6708 domain-containing protein [Dyella acidiphila]MBE1161936.1 hypothetical protein [Dyella acidiphila]